MLWTCGDQPDTGDSEEEYLRSPTEADAKVEEKFTIMKPHSSEASRVLFFLFLGAAWKLLMPLLNILSAKRALDDVF